VGSKQRVSQFGTALIVSTENANNPFIISGNNTPSVGGEDHVAAFEIS
jgi:hypothetical protein